MKSGSTLEGGNFGLRRIKLQATWGFAIVGLEFVQCAWVHIPAFVRAWQATLKH